MRDAFDADVLILAAKGDPRGEQATRIVNGSEEGSCIGSTLLIPELLCKPLTIENELELIALQKLLRLLELKPVDTEIADLAATLRAKYRLQTADAVHLATAIEWGASRFHTNNSKDFGRPIDEIDIVLS